MKHSNAFSQRLFLVLCLAALLAACGGSPSPEVETTNPASTAEPQDATNTAAPNVPSAEDATAAPTPSPTPTAEPVLLPPTPSPSPASRCQGLSGTLEVQVLVGPAEAVGLEPVAVGDVPFSVISQEAPYWVEGQAPIVYEAVLEEQWGRYTVTMDLEMAVSGECMGEAGGELLDLVLEMSGEQLVVVESEGFNGEYPWAGTHALDLSYPLEEGATAEGEGWVVVLHLGAIP